MGKMSITSYTDENFSSESHSALALPVNPAKVKLTKGIRYAEDKQLGSLNGSNAYVRYRPETLYFECLFDMTNAMEDDDEKQPVHDLVDALEERLYDYNTEGHRPSFVKVEYGDIQDAGNGIHPVRPGRHPAPRRTESDADGLLQPKGGEITLLQTLARRVTAGHAERGADTCRPLLRDIRRPAPRGPGRKI